MKFFKKVSRREEKREGGHESYSQNVNMLHSVSKALVKQRLPLRACVCQKFLQPNLSLGIRPPPFLQGLTKPHYFSKVSFHEEAQPIPAISKKSPSLKQKTKRVVSTQSLHFITKLTPQP